MQKIIAKILLLSILCNTAFAGISGTSLPLANGAATESTLSSLNTKLTTSASGVKVDGSGVVQPISAAALPLPSGAATSAIQATQQTTLNTIAAKLAITSAFGEQIVGELSPQFQQVCDVTVSNTELIDNFVTASGTVTQATGLCNVSTGAVAGGMAQMQSGHHSRYRSGMGGVARMSALMTSGVAGTQQWFGLMDASAVSATFLNGYSIGISGVTPEIVRWQNGAAFEIPQSTWDDKLDGTGASGMLIDFTKLNVFYIQYQYLGAGIINFWTENATTGLPFVFHSIKYANSATTPSTYNPNYHLMAYAKNGTTTSNMTVRIGSFAYFVEGRTQGIEVHQPFFASGARSKLTVTTEIALFTIRNKLTYAGKINYVDVLPAHFGASIEANSANNLGACRLVVNATLGGVPAWTDINTTNSVVEIDVAGTTVSGGKELLNLDLAGKNDKFIEELLEYRLYLHPGDSLTAACLSANSATIKGSILWKELM